MMRQATNKSVLHRLRRQLELYERAMPSLDLKRKQLSAEHNRETALLEQDRQRLADISDEAARSVPMMANPGLDLGAMLEIASVIVHETHLLGVALPALERVDYHERPYSLLAKPHWVDRAVELLKTNIEATLRLRVREERVRRLRHAMRRTVQRVNLFEKVLIPRNREQIRRIQIALADAERSAIVRAKIAKSRHQGERT